VIGDLSGKGARIAVITTCVPSVLGEDIKSMLDGTDVLLVDSPGFAGELETGYRAALTALAPKVDPERRGVNIDGVSLSDPFYEGNVQEVFRLLYHAGIPVGTVFCRDWYEMAGHAAPLTIGTNDDFASNVGKYLGGTLGIPALRVTFENLSTAYKGADADLVLAELDKQEERVIHACDKYLRRYDPPSVAIFAGTAYAFFAGDTLKRYMDADILTVGTRNDPPAHLTTQYPVEKLTGLEQVAEKIAEVSPDLVIGSSFEQSVSGDRTFVGIIPPLRGRVRLAHPPLAGTGGTLHFVENVLNACMDKKT
jgi:nitrogenase molybdenum-iron protein alpha/beta subunit